MGTLEVAYPRPVGPLRNTAHLCIEFPGKVSNRVWQAGRWWRSAVEPHSQNKWLPSCCSFPTWLSAAEHVQTLLMQRAPSENRTNFAGIVTTPEKCWQLITQSGGQCPPPGFLKPRRLSKAIISSDCPGKTAVMCLRRNWSLPGPLPFKVAFFRTFMA